MRDCKLHPGSFWPLRLLWWTPPAWLAGVLVLPLLQGSLPKKGFTHLKQRKLKHDSLLIFFVPRKMEILCGMLINPLSVWSSLGGEILKNPEWEDFFQKDFPWVRTTFSSFIPPPRLLDCRSGIWSLSQELCTVRFWNEMKLFGFFFFQLRQRWSVEICKRNFREVGALSFISNSNAF